MHLAPKAARSLKDSFSESIVFVNTDIRLPISSNGGINISLKRVCHEALFRTANAKLVAPVLQLVNDASTDFRAAST